MSNKLPRAAILLTARIADFDRWYETFNEAEPLRRRYGIVGHHINRQRGDENNISVYFAVTDVEAAKDFLSSRELQDVMKRAGVETTPEVTFMKPRSENVVWDRELPAIVVRHEVKELNHWKKIYDVAAAIRTKHGILGDAANTLLGDDNTVIVYHQAESFEILEKFLADPELKEAMDLAGVTSGPEVTFATGGWSKRYTTPELTPEDTTRKEKDTTARA